MEKGVHPVEGILRLLKLLHRSCGYIGKINGRTVDDFLRSAPLRDRDLVVRHRIGDSFFHFIHGHSRTVLPVNIGAREKPVFIIYAHGQVSRGHDQ